MPGMAMCPSAWENFPFQYPWNSGRKRKFSSHLTPQDVGVPGTTTPSLQQRQHILPWPSPSLPGEDSCKVMCLVADSLNKLIQCPDSSQVTLCSHPLSMDPEPLEFMELSWMDKFWHFDNLPGLVSTYRLQEVMKVGLGTLNKLRTEKLGKSQVNQRLSLARRSDRQTMVWLELVVSDVYSSATKQAQMSA